MDHNHEQQAERVYQYVALAAVDLLARVVTADPPFSVVLTDWLSMIAALGCGSRPARRRSLPRNSP